jgi:hypothetical protein
MNTGLNQCCQGSVHTLALRTFHFRLTLLPRQQLEPFEMHQDRTEHSRHWIITSDQGNREFRKSLGSCQRFQSLADVAEIMLDPKLAHPQ